MQYIIDDEGRLEVIGDAGSSIKGFQDLKDYQMLAELKREDLPLYINHPFSKTLKKFYNDRVSGESFKPFEVQAETDYYIYHCGPCYMWKGWGVIFMEDIIGDPSLFSFVYNAMSLVSEHTNWELDLRNNLYMTAIPNGDYVSDKCLGIKQDNNGETFYVCKTPLNVEEQGWGGLAYTPQGPVPKSPEW